MRDETIAAGAQKVAYGGGSLAIWGGMTATDIAAFVGGIVAILGLLVQLYYKRKADRRAIVADRRAAELHAARLARLDEDEYGEGGQP